MTYVLRNIKDSDLEILLKDSTENGKVDKDVINDSVEIKVMECDGKPVMMLGRVEYPTSDLVLTTGVWGIFSKDIEKHTKSAVKFCKDLIFDRAGFKFLVLINEKDKKFIRFAEFFGFCRTKIVEEKMGTVYHLYIKET